jgi:hypothetical protein
MLNRIINWLRSLTKYLPPKINIYFGEECVGSISALRVIDGGHNWPLQISTSNLRLKRSKVEMAYFDGKIQVSEQKYPLELRIEERNFTVVFKNCWMTCCNCSFSSGDWIIMPKVEWDSELVKVDGV